jgi:hypothetical protein
MTPALLSVVVDECPRLRSLSVEWMGTSMAASEKEAWVEALHRCTGLKELVTVSGRHFWALPHSVQKVATLPIADSVSGLRQKFKIN